MSQPPYKLAFEDFREGFFAYPIWLRLAWQEIKLQYRRSLLGPFWVTLTTGILIIGMGPLYGQLFNQPMGSYIRYLAISFVIWNYLAGTLNEVCNSFIVAEGFIKQIKLPYSLYVLKVIAKNVMLLFHNVLIIIVVLLFFPPENGWLIPLSFIGLILVTLNLFWIGLMLAMLGARFRDIPPIISSVVQLLFFLTPILWEVSALGSKKSLLEFNLLYHFIEIVRAPLLGQMPQLLSWIVMLGLLIFGSIGTFLFFARHRAKISYWV